MSSVTYRTSRRGALVLCVATALILSACGASSSNNTAASTPLTKVKILTGYLWAQSQYYSQYLLGIDKGFYAAEGLDVSFDEGHGSGSGSQLIANGQYDFGVSIASGAAIRAISKGAAIKMVASFLNVNPIGIISKKSSSLNSPSDLVGKKIGMPPGTEQASIWPAFLAKNNLTSSQVPLISINADALPAALATGKIDGYVSYAFDLPGIKSATGIDTKIMEFSDNGVVYAPGEGLVASQKIISQNPGLVTRLTRALIKSVVYSFCHPGEAADSGAKYYPDAMGDKSATVATFAIYDAVIAAPIKQGTLFPSSDSEIQATLTLLTQYTGLTGTKAPSDYYTNQFLPNPAPKPSC